ncbi:MAG: sigma-70 family RNA polymerase sigma factor [Clostridiales bacterium]|nr:sigma-70 family RNA polymerase sigma factor [Clostridiales bacterium]
MKTTREKINEYLSRLQQGEDCLKEFIDYTRGYINFIAYKYLADKSLVEDVVFLTYHKILRAIQTFDSSNNGQAWIVKIAQNEAYRFNRDEVTDDVPLEKYQHVAHYTFNEKEHLNKYDIERAIARLDEQEQTIIEYKIYMGMTVREIAKLMNIPKSTIAYTLKQALKKLENYLT